MNDLWYKMLEKQFNTDYNQYKKMKIDYKCLKAMKHKFHILEIRNNKVISTYDNTHFRINEIYKAFELGIKYSIDNNLPPITGKFYIYYHDSYNHQYNFPSFSYSKPRNKYGFLMPDFYFLNHKKKLEVFKKECKNTKINEIYFKGSNTTDTRSDIRGELSKLPKPFNIRVSTEWEPYYNICNYKYVLDIIGVKPWSVRLIELYMSKSLPIRLLFYNSEWNEEPWIQFYENMFPAWESYIALEYDYNYDTKVPKNIIKDIKKKCLKTIQVVDNNNDYYKHVVKTNYKKVKALTFEHIGYYMYHCCILYSRLLRKST